MHGTGKGFWMMRHWLFWIAVLFLGGLVAACGKLPSAVDNASVLYRDSFVVGETGPWQVEGDALGRTAVLDEQLVIQVNAPAMIQFATLSEPLFSDFVLQVDGRILVGVPQSSYGVLFRMQSATQFYRFSITGDGQYMVERRNADGSWTRFVPDWTSTPAINQGVGAVNQLRITATGSNMRFYVNDTLLQQVVDDQYASGTMGLDAGTFGHPELQVAFDNLVVSRP